MPLIGLTITISSWIRPSSAEPQDVDPLELALADPRLEHQDRGVSVLDLLDVAEVLEHLNDGAEDHAQRFTALVRP